MKQKERIFPQEVFFIQTQEVLEDFCIQVAKGGVVAVDTEFARRRTYFPVPSLVQLANSEVVALIDVYDFKGSLDSLLVLLKDPVVLKVFHAPGQDFRALFGTL